MRLAWSEQLLSAAAAIVNDIQTPSEQVIDPSCGNKPSILQYPQSDVHFGVWVRRTCGSQRCVQTVCLLVKPQRTAIAKH